MKDTYMVEADQIAAESQELVKEFNEKVRLLKEKYPALTYLIYSGDEHSVLTVVTSINIGLI